MFGVYNRRRRLTARSSGKQQAVCTVVRAALVVCPEEGHFVRFQKRKLFCRSNGCSFLGFSPASVSEGFQRASGKPFGAPAGAYPLPRVGLDAPTPAREQGLPPYGAFTLFFRWRKKSVQKKASGTATPEAARPASRNSQISAFRALPCPALVFAQACQSLTAFGSCAHWAHAPSRPKLRSAVAERLDAPNLFGASNSGP